MATDIIARAIAANALKIAKEAAEGGDSYGLKSIEINVDGELVVTFTDGTVSNLGKVVGADGKVYVPHINKDTSVLSWTIEDKEGAIPDPIDLSDSGEWSDVTEENIGDTEYEWETL